MENRPKRAKSKGKETVETEEESPVRAGVRDSNGDGNE